MSVIWSLGNRERIRGSADVLLRSRAKYRTVALVRPRLLQFVGSNKSYCHSLTLFYQTGVLFGLFIPMDNVLLNFDRFVGWFRINGFHPVQQ